MKSVRNWMLVLLLLLGFALLSASLPGASEESDGVSYKKTEGFVLHEWGVWDLRPVKDSRQELKKLRKELPFCHYKRASYLDRAARKPIIYLYSPADRKCKVELFLREMGNGCIYYPEAKFNEMANPASSREDRKRRANAYTGWSSLTWDLALTKDKPNGAGVKTEAGHWWPKARPKDASWLTSGKEFEKYLFYELPSLTPSAVLQMGLPRLAVRKQDEKVTLLFYDSGQVQDVFLIRVKDNKLSYISYDVVDDKVEESGKRKIEANKKPRAPARLPQITKEVKVDEKAWKEISLQKIKIKFIKMLVAAGLYTDEANRMIQIWEKDFFKNEGLRLLYRYSKEQYDKVFPIKVDPVPKTMARVLLTLMEVK